MKKFTLLLAFVMSLLLSFGCCTTIHNINSPRTDLVNHLKNTTVTLVVKADDGFYRPYCGAVWVNKTDLITAKHCVEDDDENVEVGFTVKFQIYKDFDNHYPISENKKVYVAKVIAQGDEHEDVALLRTMDDVEHNVATVATYTPRAGQAAHHVGHPRGLQWSYIPGTVSETRILEIRDGQRHMLHVVGLMWRGSSGGGAFDDAGNLMAICSLLMRGVPGQIMFVHIDVVRSLLDKHDIKYHTLN